LKDRGLDVAIDYKTENVNERVLEVTNGKGVDLIIDPIGGKTWNSNYALLRKGY
jgi:NADPH:quinone reductase-like Zn-dependent oxidoreductase